MPFFGLYGTKQRLDDLYLIFIAIAKRLQPKVVIAENVKGIITGNAKGWVNQIVKAFDDVGYVVQMVQNLEGMGFTVVPFGQGFKDMSPPTKDSRIMRE